MLIQKLTDRQAEVMELTCAGLSAIGIAKKLDIMPSSVMSLYRNIYKNYGLTQNENYDIKILAVRQYLRNKRSKNEV